MCEQDRENINAKGEAKDSYDEFEERIKRIGIGIVSVWRELKVSERIAHIVNLATLSAVIFYAGYTVKIYKAATTQAQLMRQQLVGTQGAVIEIRNPTWQPNTWRFTISLTNTNQGVAGRVTDFKAAFQRRQWPSEKPIGEPLPIVLINPWIIIQKQSEFGIEKGLPWQLPPKLKDLNQWPGSEIVTLEGSYTYSNGFDESFTNNFCYLWLAPWDLTVHSGQIVGGWSGGQWSGGIQGCPKVSEKIRDLKGIEEHVRELTTGQTQ